MQAANKAQITIKALTENDEIVTYSTSSDHTSCLKMRIIDGKRVYIKDNWYLGVFRSETFKTLTAAKRNLTINHF